jgi:RHS repeat-associated protein
MVALAKERRPADGAPKVFGGHRGNQANWLTYDMGGQKIGLSRYRVYDPETGVFTSRDFLRFLNRYRAWSNNPLGQVDRDGKADAEDKGVADKTLADLDSDSYDKREKAEGSLSNLTPGQIESLMDPKRQLTPQQKSTLNKNLFRLIEFYVKDTKKAVKISAENMQLATQWYKERIERLRKVPEIFFPGNDDAKTFFEDLAERLLVWVERWWPSAAETWKAKHAEVCSATFDLNFGLKDLDIILPGNWPQTDWAPKLPKFPITGHVDAKSELVDVDVPKGTTEQRKKDIKKDFDDNCVQYWLNCKWGIGVDTEGWKMHKPEEPKKPEEPAL